MSGNEILSDYLVLLRTTGEYNRFKELLRSRLYECGWVDQVHMLCKQACREHQLTVNQIYDEVGQKGRALVPASVKRELLLKVKDNLLHKAGYYDKDSETQPQP